MKKHSKKLMIIILVILALALSFEGILHLKAKSDLNTTLEEKELNYIYQFESAQKEVEIRMEKGEAYAGIVRNGLFEYVTTPLIAIWIEDENSNFISTLYVSSKLFQIDRPTALPVWQHKSNIDTSNSQLVDGVSSVSNKGNQLKLDDQISSEKFILYVELNRSYDYNDFYLADLEPGQLGYNADFSGQPSLIYQVPVDSLTTDIDLDFKLVGHGSEDGSDGDIVTALEHITTAKDLMNKISLHIQ